MGEHVVGPDPDCSSKNQDFCNPPKITRKIDAHKDIITHKYYGKPKKYSNDIALIRINDAIPLFSEDQSISAVSPICLPWSEDLGVQLKKLKDSRSSKGQCAFLVLF